MSTLDLFKTIVAEKNSLPRDQPYKDLISLINFILRKFFKSLAEDAFLAVEACILNRKKNWITDKTPGYQGVLPEKSRALETVLQLGSRWTFNEEEEEEG